ncbi:MAG: YcaO-like family protein, partial [Pseudonocardiaceae bacterium]
ARCLRSLKSAMRVENGGKGVTPLHAEVSALCEALERHSGCFHGDEERIRGSLHSLGERAIHPNRCQLYDERQYSGRTAWNAAHSPFQYVCAPFDPDAVMDWTPVWSFTQGRHRLLPTNQLYFGAPVQPGPLFARADSNGNAAGSSLEDAVLQGLLEVIERDAVALWWYNRTAAPGVDLDAFGDPWIDELRGVYAELGREVWVLDVTSDLDVPAMVALSRWADRPGEGIMFGFGAHPDPAVALRRALTELNQLMPAVVTVGPDDEYDCDDDPDAARWLRHATVANQPYLAPDRGVRPRRPADYGYLPRADLVEDVNAIRTRLESLGLELLVLDQTRPDIGLPVVKVIVPGMRHFWARFAPGRLYDVPVRLGRLAEP